MKQSLAFFWLFGVTLGLSAQTLKDISWLHRSDLYVGNEILRLGVKEVYEAQELKYHFMLSRDTATRSFNVLADDLKQGDYLQTLVFKQMKLQFDSLYSRSVALSTMDQSIVDILGERIKTSNKELSDSDKQLIEHLLDEWSQNPRQDQLDAIFKNISNDLQEGQSSSWLNEQLLSAQAKIKARKEDAYKDLEQNTRRFLNGLFEVLEKRKSDAPKVGVLYVEDTILIQHYTDSKCKFGVAENTSNWENNEPANLRRLAEENNNVLNMKKLELKFEGGQITDIKAVGYIACLEAQEIVFHNRLPISYSTKFDVAQDFNARSDWRIFSINKELSGCFIWLSDVLYNDYNLSSYTDNYSPTDTVIVLRPNEPGRVVFRERVTDILQARVYSDIIGYNDEAPNGLVQVEFSKKINLKTHAYRIFSWVSNYQYARYIIPHVSITKLERNQKYYPVSVRLNPMEPDTQGIGISTKDLLRNANFNAGGQVNFVTFGIPKYHSSIHLDFALGVILTGVSTTKERIDTTGQSLFLAQTEKNVASAVLSPLNLIWNIYPHTHYHISFHYKFQSIHLLDPVYYQKDKDPLNKGGRFMHQLGMIGGLRANDDSRGELFFRVLWNLNARAASQNFVQAQVGYTFKVFSRKVQVREKPVFSYP